MTLIIVMTTSSSHALLNAGDRLTLAPNRPVTNNPVKECPVDQQVNCSLISIGFSPHGEFAIDPCIFLCQILLQVFRPYSHPLPVLAWI